MNDGWIRLYRKSKDNPLMKDANSWMIFSWILLSVDREGKMIIGRFWASEYFSLNPSTFYKSLKRLEKKYNVVTLNSNNKYTEIIVLKWDKYQYNYKPVTQSGNNKVTTKEQQSNTIQEYKNNKNNKNIPKGIVKLPNEDINFLISYLKEKLKLPLLDGTDQMNRRYCWLSLKKFGGLEKMKLLIDATAQHEFWSTRITGFQQLYYKAVNIISSGRDKKFSVTKL